MKIASLALLIAVIGCGRAPEIKTRAPLFTSTDKLVVSEKADKDLIRTKFQNAINLKCSFFVSNWSGFNTNLLDPTKMAGFSVNVARGETADNFFVEHPVKHKFTTGIRVRKLDILPEATVPGANGITHRMKDTPEVELVIRGRDVLGNRDNRYEKIVTVKEKSPVIIQDLYPKKYPHILRCELVTSIAEEYEGDYTEEVPEITVE